MTVKIELDVPDDTQVDLIKSAIAQIPHAVVTRVDTAKQRRRASAPPHSIHDWRQWPRPKGAA